MKGKKRVSSALKNCLRPLGENGVCTKEGRRKAQGHLPKPQNRSAGRFSNERTWSQKCTSGIMQMEWENLGVSIYATVSMFKCSDEWVVPQYGESLGSMEKWHGIGLGCHGANRLC